jgi:hypothetical protein
MKWAFKAIISVILCISVTGCAHQAARMTATSSGHPEIEISKTSIDEIKSAIITRKVRQGFQVEKDTPYMLELTQPAQGGDDIAAALSVGNAYSENQRLVTYNFSKQSDGVHIIAIDALQAQLPGGQTNKVQLTSGNAYNATQQDLYNLEKQMRNEKSNSKKQVGNK